MRERERERVENITGGQQVKVWDSNKNLTNTSCICVIWQRMCALDSLTSSHKKFQTFRKVISKPHTKLYCDLCRHTLSLFLFLSLSLS